MTLPLTGFASMEVTIRGTLMMVVLSAVILATTSIMGGSRLQRVTSAALVSVTSMTSMTPAGTRVITGGELETLRAGCLPSE